MLITSDQIKSAVRAVLMLLFGGTLGVWLIKHGVTVDDNFITMATGIVSGIVAFVWGQIFHRTPT